MPSKQGIPSKYTVLRVHAGQKPPTAHGNHRPRTLTLTFVSRADRVTTTGLLEVLVATPAAEAAAERCIRAEAIFACWLMDGGWVGESVDERGVFDCETFGDCELI